MARKDLSHIDASRREEMHLESALRRATAAPKEKLISVEEALRQKPIATKKSNRSAVRVLFISQDTTLLNPTTQSLDGYMQLKDLFEEVHILILRTGIPAKNPALRVDENVWLYTASVKAWWQLPTKGIDLLEQQLVFANGFRPDLIVARDPYESALVGKKIAEQYRRPLQVHVLNEAAGEKLRYNSPKNIWRRFMPNFTIPAATSIRADSENTLQKLQKKFAVSDSSLLPSYHNYRAFIQSPPNIDLANKYQPHIFFFLYVGTLDANSKAYQAIDAVRTVIKNPRIALLILGDGPIKDDLMKRAKLLGVAEQIIFESKVSDIISYFKGAHVLLATDTSKTMDDIILKAAAAGLPAIMARNEFRQEYFEDGVSGIISEPDSIESFTDKVNLLLNNAGQRKLMGEYAQNMVLERFHDSEEQYQKAFQMSIEQTLFAVNSEDKA